jgi:hypothetical protein
VPNITIDSGRWLCRDECLRLFVTMNKGVSVIISQTAGVRREGSELSNAAGDATIALSELWELTCGGGNVYQIVVIGAQGHVVHYTAWLFFQEGYMRDYAILIEMF